MWLTTKVDAPNQPITERPAAASTTATTPNNVIISVLDGSQLEVYSRKQGVEETTLCMKVYMGCFLGITYLVMRAAFV